MSGLMNKYQEALDNLCFNCDPDSCIKPFCKDYEDLKELVEKATPKKPIQLKNKNRHKCPNCESQLPFTKNAINKHMPRIYCDRCGQRIDYRSEDVE